MLHSSAHQILGGLVKIIVSVSSQIHEEAASFPQMGGR
ncbi:hypothetical protein FM109_09080 [Vibrio casei]|nr:hypothetical protein FM109_09080 [Vibrio casei]